MGKAKVSSGKDLTTGPIGRGILAFAIPLFLGQLLQQLYNVADAWVVGNFANNNAFTAWEGDFAGCDVVKQGYELNEKPRLVLGCVPTFSIASVKNGTVVLDTIKPALDRSGDLILRLYESKKAAGKAQILLNVDAKKAWLCDMLENKEQEIVIKDGMLELEFGAFQIQTIRLSIEEAMA